MRHGTRLTLGLVTLTLLVAACTDADGGSADPAALPEGEAAAGEAVYAANCAACHGADLRGTGAGPPLLDDVYEPSHHGDVAFVLAIREGVQPHHWDFGAMPPIRDLSDQEVADVIAHVREQQEAAGIR